MKRLRTTIQAMCILLLSCSITYAQDNMANGISQLEHKKKTFQDDDKKIYWNVSIPAYVKIAPAPTGESYDMTTVKKPSMKQYSMPMYFDGHGIHYIRHFDYEHPIPENEVAFEVYVDGLAPKTSVELSGAPKVFRNGVLYYGKGLSGTLTATDEMSKLDKTYHSLDGNAYSEYANTLLLDKEKQYTYRYYSVDRVGNVEKPSVKQFTVDLTAPETKHEISGIRQDMIFSKKVSIKLNTEDALSGVKSVTWNFNNTSNSNYTKPIWVSYLPDGEHTLFFTSKDYVNNEEEVRSVKFYLDKIAPEVTAKIEGDLFEKDGKSYISERSKISLTATDNKAGVDKIFYSIDGATADVYAGAFTLNKKQGRHFVKYKAVDKVENMGSLKTDANSGNLYLDLNAPTVSYAYMGAKFFTRDTMFITSETDVILKAIDYQSGVQKIMYALDQASEAEYASAINVSAEGFHDVGYYSLDQVNNKKEDDFFFMVDNTGPEVFHHFSIKEIGFAEMEDAGKIPIYAPHSQLFLAATDKAVGTDKIYYSLDGKTERLYTGPIKNLSKGMRTLNIRSVDHLGNETNSKAITFMIK